MPSFRSRQYSLSNLPPDAAAAAISTPAASRLVLLQHISVLIPADPNLTALFSRAARKPLPTPTPSVTTDAPPSQRPFPYGVLCAARSLSVAALSDTVSDSISSPSHPSAAQPVRALSTTDVTRAAIDPAADDPPSSIYDISLNLLRARAPQPPPKAMHAVHDSVSCMLPPIEEEHSTNSLRLSSRPSLSGSKSTLALLSGLRVSSGTHSIGRPLHTPVSFNPFSTMPTRPALHTMDIFKLFTLDTFHCALPALRATLSIPLPLAPTASAPPFITLVHGYSPAHAPFIFESRPVRVWQEDTTWRKEIRGTTPLLSPLTIFPTLPHPHSTASARRPSLWPLLLPTILSRMLVLSAGLQHSGHDCLRAVAALQTIREMLRWRALVRSAIMRVPPPPRLNVLPFGTFSFSVDGWLQLDGSHRPHSRFLDPTAWQCPRDVALALVAWVNVDVDVCHDVTGVLCALPLSIRGISQWCRVALQFAATHDVDSAVALVGVMRFLFVRKWLPAGSLAAGHFCANEFLDCAMAVPELERCLPEVLGVGYQFGQGHDMDTGPVVLAELDGRKKGGYGTSRVTEDRLLERLSSATCVLPKKRRSTSDMNGSSVRGDETSSTRTTEAGYARRVVMSVWTDELRGDEWHVPGVVACKIDFRVSGVKYRLWVSHGEVTCRRIGRSAWLRKRMGRGRTPLDGREASGGQAVANALGRVYGDAVCFQMLAWLHRGEVRLCDTCTAACYVPQSSLGGTLVVNQRLQFEICRQMVFGRKGHELYWMPGEGLPCFLLEDYANGTYRLTEMPKVPPGVEPCRAEIAKDFG